MKILHTADWHIGNFPGPQTDDNSNARFNDICNGIEFLISKAIAEQPDIIIIAGDIFHQAKIWADRGLNETDVVIKYLQRLSAVAPVCLLRGTPNHDGKSQFNLLMTALADNQDIYIIDEACVKTIANTAVAFMPIIDKNIIRAESETALDKAAETKLISERVKNDILTLKDEADKTGLPSILVTHYTVIGSIMPNGQVNVMSANEVTIDPLTLITANFDLVCLGHIHKPQQLGTCDNAFYSGSLLPLTFNDERDMHGFYMHYITSDADGKHISSEFIETPSRTFRTMVFDDTQLNDIISKDYDITGYFNPDDTKDSIVRVIYRCVDITNKKLNKALLEKALYEQAEVFFVQEITPESIMITVDKTAMPTNSSITDNVRKFLTVEMQEHGSITENQINDCVAAAQPIADEIMSSFSMTQSTGIFMPIEISVKNYRNYKDATFSYENVKFCVINGENGAGKSSLFMDAMLDALFEEPREGELTGWINNSPNIKSGSIRFTFSIGDNTYRVTRTRQKSGKATLNLAVYMQDENGEFAWVDASEEKMKDTQAVINDLISMDATTLKSCGLIMQDAYGLFLQADRTTRMSILGNILGLSFYDDLLEIASDMFKRCQDEVNKIDAEQQEILEQLIDGQKTQNELNEALTLKSEYDFEMKDCNNTLMSHTIKRESFIKDIENYNRVIDEMNALKAKKAELETALAKQMDAVAKSDEIIAKEPAYLEAKARYDELIEQEKALEAKNSEIAALGKIRSKLEEDAKICQNIFNDANDKIAKLTEEKEKIETEIRSAADTRSKAELYEATKKEIVEIEAKTAEINELQASYTASEQIMNRMVDEDTRFTEKHNAELEECDKQACMLAESGCPIADKAPCKFLAAARKTVESKPGLIAEYDRRHKEYLDSVSKTVNDMNILKESIEKIKKDLPDLNRKKQELAVYESYAFKSASLPEQQKRLELYIQQIADFKAIRDENSTKLDKLTAQLDENTKQITALTLEVAGLNDIRYELDRLRNTAKLGEEIAAAKASRESALARKAELEKEIQMTEYDSFTKFREYKSYNIDQLELANIDASITACHARADLLTQNINENGKLIGRLEAEMNKYKDDCRKLNHLKLLMGQASYAASNYAWLKKAFARNGIPHNITRSVIPLLETTATTILNQMSNNRMSIELRTERTLTTKKEVATLDVIVNDTVTGNLPYLSRSGGERVKAALSVILALAEIKSSQNGMQLGFLFIDEPPFLDAQGVEAYCDALMTIQQRYSNLKIMAITHDPAMKSRFNQSIDIIKTPNGSQFTLNL